MYCVSIDPGGTTGICVVPDEDRPWNMELYQLGPREHHWQLLHELSLWKPEVIICETYENTGSLASLLIAPEYIGVVRLYEQTRNHPDGPPTLRTRWQSAGTALTFWSDKRLRDYNIYRTGVKHARDAQRHYLYFRTFTCGDQTLLKGDVRGYVN